MQKQTQQTRLIQLLTPNEWVSLIRILSLGIAQYNTRIKELREQGHFIENKVEWVGGIKHSWFRRDPSKRWISRKPVIVHKQLTLV